MIIALALSAVLALNVPQPLPLARHEPLRVESTSAIQPLKTDSYVTDMGGGVSAITVYNAKEWWRFYVYTDSEKQEYWVGTIVAKTRCPLFTDHCPMVVIIQPQAKSWLFHELGKLIPEAKRHDINTWQPDENSPPANELLQSMIAAIMKP